VHLEQYLALGARDRLEHRRKGLAPIPQQTHAILPHDEPWRERGSARVERGHLVRLPGTVARGLGSTRGGRAATTSNASSCRKDAAKERRASSEGGRDASCDSHTCTIL